MKMNKDYVEQIYRSSLERSIMAIMQESFGNCAEELLSLRGRSGNTLLDDIIEDENGDIRVSIGHVLAGRLRELEDIGKDRPVPEGQKSWTICISNSEGYPASFMHFEGTAEEVQTALLQLAAEDRAKAPDEYECGCDPEDIGASDDGFYDMHVAYKDYRIDYSAMEGSRIEVFSRDILSRGMPSFEEEKGMDTAAGVADKRFSELKKKLFMGGPDDIVNFLGFDYNPSWDYDMIENAMDDVYSQMPDEELEEFYRKYNIPEQDEDIER